MNTDPTSTEGFLRAGASYIKNPLGIIGLFVALIYGVAVLVAGFSPNLCEGQRWVMVVFSVVFPVAVLAVFFRLVTHHHNKLYAPADWKDERHFFGPQLSQAREVREADAARLLAAPPEELPKSVTAPQQIAAEHDSTIEITPPPLGLPESRLLAKESEDLAHRWLAKQFPHERLYRDVRIEGPNDVAFDGIVHRPRSRHLVAIEVKSIRHLKTAPRVIREFGALMDLALANMNSVPEPGTIAFMLVIVAIGLSPSERDRIVDLTSASLRDQNRTVDVRVLDLDELRQQFA